ncbi:hypothetical protein FJZ26_04040 [Candidatus Parvarchaeota archaeon]|nr:hypothetical protein [Candidatus Parvarchaeota archaeon]
MAGALARIKTGVKGLDEVLGGGLPAQSNVLLFGSPMCGKKPLLMELVFGGLKQGIPALYLLTDYSYRDWKKMMAISGQNIEEFEKKGLARVIDCYSKQFDLSLRDGEVVTYPEAPSAISSISLHISRAEKALLEQKCPFGYRVGFHSLSALFEATTPAAVSRFLQFTIGKFRNSNATVFYALEKGMHDEKVVTMAKHLMDGVFEFNDSGQISISGIIGAQHTPQNFRMSERGFEFISQTASGRVQQAAGASAKNESPLEKFVESHSNEPSEAPGIGQGEQLPQVQLPLKARIKKSKSK